MSIAPFALHKVNESGRTMGHQQILPMRIVTDWTNMTNVNRTAVEAHTLGLDPLVSRVIENLDVRRSAQPDGQGMNE
jgi:hypothetical protein